jgi:hypothetical protein
MAPAVVIGTVFWRAGRDRIAHGRVKRSAARALCGEVVPAENAAWPELRRCLACSSLADGMKAVAG